MTDNPQTPPHDDRAALEHAERFDGILTIMLVIAALLAIYMEVLDNNLALSDTAAQIVIAEANRSQIDLYTAAKANQNDRLYSQYATNYALELALVDEESLSYEVNDYLQAQASEMALIDRFYFPTRYLLPDGSFDGEQNRNDIFTQRSARLDADPSDDYASYDAQREASQLITILSFVSLASLSVYGLEKAIYPLRWRIRIALITVATLLLFAAVLGVVAALTQGVF